MNIERSIYTHTKVRRDTRSTGFGYYSETPGMSRLFEQSARLSAVSAGFISPRNSDIWWEKEEQDLAKRDEVEAARIHEHHPVCFGYSTVNVGGKDNAVLTFGRNLGRDLSPMTRDGNILVNTLTFPADEIEGYPYEYYGSSELFVDYERGFFLNAPDEPAADLEPLQSLTKGCAPTAEEIESFLSEDERLQALCSMLGALMKINDGGTLRRILVCDSKDNIIKWIAALSLIFPAETAKKFTFKTYSFLGSNSDDFQAVYDDVMLCGVYTPSVNGDPGYARATNYDFARERDNASTALFDFEQGHIYECDDARPYFSAFIESAFSTDMRILGSYHDFLLNKTSYRALDSDHARGYGCYTILQLKNEHSLKNLRDAYDFASKYMDSETLRQLLRTAYSCTIDAGRESASFADILDVSKLCIRQGTAAEELVKAHYISFMIHLLTSEQTAGEDYFRLREQIRPLFDGKSSYEQELVSSFTAERIMQMTSVESAGWKLTELARCVCKVMLSGKSDSELMRTFDDLAFKQILSSDSGDRLHTIGVFADMFKKPAQKVAFLDDMYPLFDERPDIRTDLVKHAAKLCINEDDSVIYDVVSFAQRNGMCGSLCAFLIDDEQLPQDIFARAELFESLFRLSDGMFDDFFEMFISDLERCEEGDSCEKIYLIYSFASQCRRTECADVAELCRRYYRAGAEVFGSYGLGGQVGLHLLEMITALPDPSVVMHGALGNMFTMLFVWKFAEEPDITKMWLPKEAIMKIDFDIMNKSEREKCVALLGSAFAARSVMLGSALRVDYDLFVDINNSDNEDALCEVFTEWVTSLAERPIKTSPQLVGQAIGMSALCCTLDAKKICSLFDEFRVKLSDVEHGVFSRDVSKYIDTHSADAAGTKVKLTNLMNDIADISGGKGAHLRKKRF